MPQNETTRTPLQIAADNPAVKDQIERFMADRFRCMPSERVRLEAMGFKAKEHLS